MHLALIAAGFVFSISLYSVQPALVAIEAHFAAPLGGAAIGMSLPIFGMVIGSLAFPLIARNLGRFMGLAMIGVGIAGISAAWAPRIEVWGMIRFLQGLGLAAIPALAMAGLGRLFPTRAVAMVGFFTGLSAIGAALGRMASGVLIEAFGVPVAFSLLSLPALLVGVLLLTIRARVLLPRPRYDLQRWPLYLFGATLLFTNLLLSNMLPYWLTDHGLSVGAIGLLFFVYFAATLGSSSGGWLTKCFGYLGAARIGLVIALAGLVMMGIGGVTALIAGFSVVLFGVFASHAVGSGVAGLVGSGVSGSYVAAYYLGGGLAGLGYPPVLALGPWAGLLTAALALALATALAHRAVMPATTRRAVSEGQGR